MQRQIEQRSSLFVNCAIPRVEVKNLPFVSSSLFAQLAMPSEFRTTIFNGCLLFKFVFQKEEKHEEIYEYMSNTVVKARKYIALK